MDFERQDGAPHICHGTGEAVRTPVSKGSGRVGRCGGAAALGGRVTFGRAAERERERDLFLREDRQEVTWRGKGSLHASAPLWDTRRALDRARSSPGHHHLSIYRNADPLGRVTGHDSRGRDNLSIHRTTKRCIRRNCKIRRRITCRSPV